MNLNIEQEVAAMRRMSITELREKYESVFGETTTTRHAPCLIRRIAWRMQANELGGLSERARQRARNLADEANLRMTAPKPPGPPIPRTRLRHPAHARHRPIRRSTDHGTGFVSAGPASP